MQVKMAASLQKKLVRMQAKHDKKCDLLNYE
jgi:hypothetical protein